MRHICTAAALVIMAGCKKDPATPKETQQPATWGYTDRPVNDSCLPWDRPDPGGSIALTRVAQTLDFDGLVGLVHPPGDDSWWYAIEQSGSVWRVDLEGGTQTLALDLGDVVSSGFELGLLGLAFHPDFASNGQVFLSYTAQQGGQKSIIDRATVAADGFSLEGRQTVFQVSQPYENHNGGNIAFGPDGYLYFGLGDGGAANDPLEAGQDPDQIYGSMIRIDIDQEEAREFGTYGIPEDNPYVSGGGLPEIYAIGLRNPWRFSFDAETGELWAGDVGQNRWEEVDRIERGGNYGWDDKEGFACFEEDPCDSGPWTDPVVAYEIAPQGASVVGGFVYRGSALPELTGQYLFTDFYYGQVWRVLEDPITGEAEMDELASADGLYFSGWGQDASGELYLHDYYGRIFRVDPGEAGSGSGGPPTDLAALGCMDPDDPTQPGPGLIAYGVQAPLWSDGADKERWFALPEGTQIGIEDDGSWSPPVGTVTVKHFRQEGVLVETRFMVRHEDGDWGGYTYAWNDDASAATLLAGSATRTVDGVTWEYPSRGDCARCHTPASGGALGLQGVQLDGSFEYPNGAIAHQLEQLAHIGLISGDAVDISGLTDPSDTGAPLEDRARAMLHANCAQCHQPGGTGAGEQDLRHDTPLAEAGLCDVLPQQGDLGVSDAVLLAPGDPARSILVQRMLATDAHRMPPLGTHTVDQASVDLLSDWIAGMSGCGE